MSPRPPALPPGPLTMMTLIAIAASLVVSLPGRTDEAIETPATAFEPLLLGGLDLRVGNDALEAAAIDDTGPDLADQPRTRVHFSLGEQARLRGLGALRPTRHPRIAFGIGPQVLETSRPAERLASDLIGDSLLEHHRYALIGFAGYRSYRGWAAGPEAWVNDDPGYRIRGLGLAVRDLRAGPLRMDLRLGATRQQNQTRIINGGIEFRWYKP